MIIIRGILFRCFESVGFSRGSQEVVEIVHLCIEARFVRRGPVVLYGTVVGAIIIRAIIAIARIVALFRADRSWPIQSEQVCFVIVFTAACVTITVARFVPVFGASNNNTGLFHLIIVITAG